MNEERTKEKRRGIEGCSKNGRISKHFDAFRHTQSIPQHSEETDNKKRITTFNK